MKTKRSLVCMAVLLAIALTACSQLPSETHLDFEQQSDSTGIAGELSQKQLSFEETPETDGNMKSGKLIYTLTGARAVNHAADIPEGSFSDSGGYLFMFPDGKEALYTYPEFIQEDGSFIDGAYLVLVDFTVESQDAVCKTPDDVEPDGTGGGKYSDPYIFQADSFFPVYDTSQADPSNPDSAGNRYRSYYLAFFSMLNNREEHPYAFRLLPGETVGLTVGYLVGDNVDGTPNDLTNVCVRSDVGTYINLSLEVQ